MASSQGVNVSPGENAVDDVSTAAAAVLDSNGGSQKATHSLDVDDEVSSLSPATKKRRTGSASGDDEGPLIPTTYTASSLEQQIQQAAARSSNPRDTTDINDDRNGDKKTTDSSSTDDTSHPAETAPGLQTDSTNVVEVLSSIMGHTERLEEHYALNKQLHELGNQSNLIYPKANSHLQSQSLPILDNLATQILSLLARSTYQEITAIVSEPTSEDAQAYSTMRSLFDHTKRVYSTSGPFLSASELGLTELDQVEIIRKANMASFVSSIFGSQEVGFSALNDHFLDIFVPEGGRLLKVQGAIFLELKTQAFISAINGKECTNSELLYRLFPDDLGLQLLSRRPGSRHLAPTETDFVKRAWSRRDILLAEADNTAAATKLPERYQWESFLRDLSTYISKNFEIAGQQQVVPRFQLPLGGENAKLPQKPIKARPSTTTKDAPEPQAVPLETQFPVAPPHPPEPPAERPGRGDLVARAARAAQIALQGQGLRQASKPASDGSQKSPQPQTQPQQQQVDQQIPQPEPESSQPQQQQQQQQQQQNQPGQSLSPVPPMPPSPSLNTTQQQGYQPHNAPGSASPSQVPQSAQITFRQQPPLQFQQYNPNAAMTSRANVAAANYGYMPGVPHYSQSQPTQILYERARLATTAKSSPSSRRAGLPSQRRPWTTEEENALMAGLDRVKGPHWSQILAMFGPGGTISEALKDRNQVQLKDKARNLKLFFLKSGIEVPYYLKFVTGELKTRAPAQAAKHEARERERQQGEEDKAHVEGIEGMMALAGAHAGASPESQGIPSASPGIEVAGPPAQPPMAPEPQQRQTIEQTTEQVLIQRLTQEGNESAVSIGEQQNTVDPALQQPPRV